MATITGFTNTTTNPFVSYNSKTYFNGLTGTNGNYYYNNNNLLYIFHQIGNYNNASGSITFTSNTIINMYLVGGGGNGGVKSVNNSGGMGGNLIIARNVPLNSGTYNFTIGGSASSSTFTTYTATAGANGIGSTQSNVGYKFADSSSNIYFYGGGGGQGSAGGNGYNSIGGTTNNFGGGGGGGYNSNGGNCSGFTGGQGGGPNGGAGGVYQVSNGANGGILSGGGGAPLNYNSILAGNGGCGGGGGGGNYSNGNIGGGNGGIGGGGGGGNGGSGGAGGIAGGGGGTGTSAVGVGGVGLLVIEISQIQAVPTISITNSTTSSITFSISGSPGATSYNLYYSTTNTIPASPNVTGITASTYTISSLTANTQYYLWLTAVGNGTSPPTTITTSTIPLPSISINSNNTNSIIVNISGGSSYNLYYSTTNTIPASPNVTGISGSSYTIQSLSPNTLYYIWLTSVVNSTYSSPVTINTSTTPLSPIISINSITQSNITVNISGGSSYNLYYNTTNSIPGTPNVTNITGSSYTIPLLTANTTYYIWVVSIGNSLNSIPATISSGTSSLPPPIIINNITQTTITLTIGSSVGATSYSLYYNTTNIIPSSAYASNLNANTSYRIKYLSPNTTYYIWVTATNSNSVISPPTQMIVTTTTIPCFKKDTKILTNNGYVLIQDLKNGDLVKILNNEYKSIDMIGKKEITHKQTGERIKDQLYKCSQNKYPELFEDLIMTGCHSILVEEFKDELERSNVEKTLGNIYVTEGRYRLPTCVDERANVYEIDGDYTVYHIALENDDYYTNYGIYANGLLVESCSKRYLVELSDMDLIK
jgi:hypothetical protein